MSYSSITHPPDESSAIGAIERAFVSGLAHAAAGLSEMVGQEIRISDPRLAIVPLATAMEVVEPSDAPSVGIYLGITGPLNAHIVLLLSPENAFGLIDLLMGQEPGTTRALDDMARSALGEVGNVMGSFFATVLGELTALTLWSTTPTVETDMARALVDGLMASACEGGDQILLLRTRFAQAEGSTLGAVSGTFLVLPDAHGLGSLLGALERRR